MILTPFMIRHKDTETDENPAASKRMADSLMGRMRAEDHADGSGRSKRYGGSTLGDLEIAATRPSKRYGVGRVVAAISNRRWSTLPVVTLVLCLAPTAIAEPDFGRGERAGPDWWSLQPVQNPSVPDVGPTRSAIDTFLLERLRARDLEPADEADRRTLIRRVTFDLIGLPPTPAEVQAFVEDPSPDAYERLVDRLLASPRHGERWARHWLDVARYGESNGFEYDALRPNAWRYRDWVIKALNADLPYDEFARLQLAGDVLDPRDPDALTATSFLVCGAYDTLIPASDIMRAINRQDEIEDFVSTVGQTFLGLTVHCARCHDHKFDPISQREYYRLASALDGVSRSDRRLLTRSERRLVDKIAAHEQKIRSIDDRARSEILAKRARNGAPTPPSPYASWDFRDGLDDQQRRLAVTLQPAARLDHEGLHVDGHVESFASTSPILTKLREKTLEVWVKLANLERRGGGCISVQTLDGRLFDAIVYAEKEPGRWMSRSDNNSRTQSFRGVVESEADDHVVHVAIVYDDTGAITAYRNGEVYGQAYESTGPLAFAEDTAQVLFGLRHGREGADGGMLSGVIERARLYDRALSAREVAASANDASWIRRLDLLAQLSAEERERRAALTRELAEWREAFGNVSLRQVYAVKPREPGKQHVLLRGNPLEKGAVVSAGGVAAVAAGDADFGLTPEAPEKHRRMALARWVSHPGNPLFARVIVNRLWHYHFGRGIVETPNDLGFNGGRPSHPRLLDWLASDVARRGWSLKALHRKMVLSAAYRRKSSHDERAAGVDANNVLLWRKSPLRLEAEALRDAILSVTDELNLRLGGPPFRDFKETTDSGTRSYISIDPVGPPFHRRSVYRTWARGSRHPLLMTFDCPDPSATAPKRSVTTTPLQALSLLNNSFVLRMSESFAHRLEREAETAHNRVELAYQLAFARPPQSDELERCVELIERRGLAALCRVLINANEFLYVD